MSKPEWVYSEILVRLRRPQIYAFRGIALEEQVQTLFDVNACGVYREFDWARPEYIEKVFEVKCPEDYSLYNHELYRGVGYIEELLPAHLPRIEKLNLTAEHLRNIYERFALMEIKDGIRSSLASRAAKQSANQPAPRYDDVHADGVEWLDELAGELREPRE